MKHLFPGATGHFSLIQGCYWMTYCILISFSSLYLLDRGFTNTQIGLLLGIAGLTAAILQPFVGAKGDHLKVLSLRQFTSLPIAAMILCGVGLFLVPAKPVQAALYMVLLVLLQLLTPLIYSLGMDCLNNHIELNFGLARGIGGGTYAKAIPNVVAFGPIFPGDEVREHKPDEFIEIDKLMKNAQIIAEAMYQLAK